MFRQREYLTRTPIPVFENAFPASQEVSRMSASFPRSTPSIPLPFERAEDDAVLQRDRRAEHAAELRFAGGFPKTIHRRDIGIRPVAHSGHTSLCERI